MRLLQEQRTLKYWVLVEYLREQIAAGELQPGSRIPSLAEMQSKFGVSRATVEKAYTLLEQDGVLIREQGRGTFVAPQSASRATKPEAKKLGLVLHVDSLTSFYMELLAGIHSEASRQNLELLWLDGEDVIGGREVDAVLMCCHPSEALALNLSPQVPHALLFHHSSDFTFIAADDFGGVREATRHLLELGHRRIAYMPSAVSDPILRRRLAGYGAALQEAGLQTDDGLVKILLDQQNHSYHKLSELTMESWMKGGWQELGCTAILAHNDEAAIGVIKVLREHGLRVPEDVSVIGFDGTKLCELSTPALTTIKVPLRELGATAVKTLATQLEQGVAPELQQIVLPVQLQVGASTAPAELRSEILVSPKN